MAKRLVSLLKYWEYVKVGNVDGWLIA